MLTMRNDQILLQTLSKKCTKIHKKRLIPLNKFGRMLETQTSVKHAIKRIGRLLGNTLLHQEKNLIYRWHAHLITRANSFPVIWLIGRMYVSNALCDTVYFH
ncbi:hypothetical protein BZJ19_05755 [Salinivibrio proteolyticus]|nr:hypothetical protein BZJ19_05755 [Salinivibrio proteolyticus]